MRFLGLVKQDFMYQIRHNIYSIYALITMIYTGILRVIPLKFKYFFIMDTLLTDTTLLGLFFIGAIIILEKDQNTLSNIFISPVKVKEYILSKALSFGFLSVLVSLLFIYLGGESISNLPVFIINIFLSSALFTIIGVGIGAKSKSLNSYIFYTIFYGLFFSLPALKFLTPNFSTVLWAIPTMSTIKLFELSLKMDFSLNYFLISLGILLISLVISLKWSENIIEKYIIRGGN